jgi:uncharacterized membrane protein
MKQLLLMILIIAPQFALAQEPARNDQLFKAEVLEIIDEQEASFPDGTTRLQQDLRLKGLEGEFMDKTVEFFGIGNLDVISSQAYGVGDRVMLAASFPPEGEAVFYIVDYVRTGALWWLVALFMAVLIAVGRFKGLRSLVSLVLSFVVIIKYIIPNILSGASPLFVTLIGSLFILFIIIYITEGFKPRAHLAVASIFISLFLTIVISSLFVSLAKLTGAASEDVLFLFNIEGVAINLEGLLLAGIIIGALGVLDDVVISQVATVEELKSASPSLRGRALFKKAYAVGVSHIASMTNTLFLAYAGVSLPLLILFASGESVFTGFSQAINTELLATEIVRTLSGSIGLILSVPIATFISSYWYSRK